MNRAMKRVVSTYTSQFTLRNSPRATFSKVYAVNPKAKPLAMLNVSGMVIIVSKAGIESTGLDQGISAAWAIMSDPTIIRAGAVAAVGIAPTTGATKSAIKKSTPVVIA